ncbi:hypothetical protein SAMN05444360_101454 [Chryseobacterium carnipullorum]|nr:hypothetical protein SAMN05444360_101454 [Chryseobacterium carnipullorum]
MKKVVTQESEREGAFETALLIFIDGYERNARASGGNAHAS